MELPDLASRAELVRRYAHLLHHFGKEIGPRPLVRQNNSFFPDPFEKDEASVVRLVNRLQTHAGLEDIPIDVRLVSLEAAELVAGGCGSGSCAPAQLGNGAQASRLLESEAGWVLNVFDAEVHHPVALTCSLARALARVFLAETESAEAPVETPLESSVDLTSVALGFGTLMLEGSYVYAKSCGGPSVSQLTHLNVGELAVASSLFITLGGHSSRRACTELGTTQRALLGEACDWAASNARLLHQLGSAPGQLASSAPALTDTRPWLVRLFDRTPRRPAEPSLELALSGDLDDAALLELARSARTRPASAGGDRSEPLPRPANDARRDELRALVDEALRGS